MSTATGVMDAPEYPLRFDVEYPEQLNRWLVLVKWLLAIPHLLIVGALLSVAYVISLIAFFAILFTTRYPRELFDFVVNIYRWNANATAYFDLRRDESPPFSWEPGQYPVTYEIDYPEQLNRWLPLVKWLLAVPHFIVLAALGIAASVVWVIAFFAILFTGSYPRGLFDFVQGVIRWHDRVLGYALLLVTDRYPPFRLAA